MNYILNSSLKRIYYVVEKSSNEFYESRLEKLDEERKQYENKLKDIEEEKRYILKLSRFKKQKKNQEIINQESNFDKMIERLKNIRKNIVDINEELNLVLSNNNQVCDELENSINEILEKIYELKIDVSQYQYFK
jgi:hypothetical protein